MENKLENALLYISGLLESFSKRNDMEKRFFERVLDYISHDFRHLNHNFGVPDNRVFYIFNLYDELGRPENINDFAFLLLKYALKNQITYHELWYLKFADDAIPVTDEIRLIYKETLWDQNHNNDLRQFCLDQVKKNFNDDFIDFYDNQFENFIKQEYNNQELLKFILRDAYWAHEKVKNRDQLFNLIRNYITKTNIDTGYMHDKFLILLGLEDRIDK